MGFWGRGRLRLGLRRTSMALLAPVAVAVLGGGPALVWAAGTARIARTITVRDNARLRVVRSNGATRLDKGPVSGTLPGSLELGADVPGTSTSFTFSFTLHVAGGTITGRGKGTLHEGNPPYETFAGTGIVSSGTGRFARVSGAGRFYGSENRRTRSGTVQVDATLRY